MTTWIEDEWRGSKHLKTNITDLISFAEFEILFEALQIKPVSVCICQYERNVNAYFVYMSTEHITLDLVWGKFFSVSKSEWKGVDYHLNDIKYRFEEIVNEAIDKFWEGAIDPQYRVSEIKEKYNDNDNW